MASPLQSIHLMNYDRREEFRQARAMLLQACGEVTLAGEINLRDSATFAPSILPSSSIQYSLEDSQHAHALKLGVNTIGRLTDNDVVLSSVSVSRRHCAVLVHGDGRCEVYDIASKNGTLLNQIKLTGSHRLRPGDVIEISDCRLTFQIRLPSQTIRVDCQEPRASILDQTMAE